MIVDETYPEDIRPKTFFSCKTFALVAFLRKNLPNKLVLCFAKKLCKFCAKNVSLRCRMNLRKWFLFRVKVNRVLRWIREEFILLILWQQREKKTRIICYYLCSRPRLCCLFHDERTFVFFGRPKPEIQLFHSCAIQAEKGPPMNNLFWFLNIRSWAEKSLTSLSIQLCWVSMNGILLRLVNHLRLAWKFHPVAIKYDTKSKQLQRECNRKWSWIGKIPARTLKVNELNGNRFSA